MILNQLAACFWKNIYNLGTNHSLERYLCRNFSEVPYLYKTVTGTSPRFNKEYFKNPWNATKCDHEKLYFCGGGGDWEKFMVPSYRLVQCCGSVTYWYGSRFADPYHWFTNPDSDPDPAPFPALLVGDLINANKQKISKFFCSLLFLKLTSFFNDKAIKKSQRSKNHGFSYWWWKDPDPYK